MSRSPAFFCFFSGLLCFFFFRQARGEQGSFLLRGNEAEWKPEGRSVGASDDVKISNPIPGCPSFNKRRSSRPSSTRQSSNDNRCQQGQGRNSHWMLDHKVEDQRLGREMIKSRQGVWDLNMIITEVRWMLAYLTCTLEARSVMPSNYSILWKQTQPTWYTLFHHFGWKKNTLDPMLKQP